VLSRVPLVRALLLLGSVLGVLAVMPAFASAAFKPTLTVTPANLQAAGDPNITIDAKLLSSGSRSDTPKVLSIGLAPGLLSSAAAHPSCVTGTPQLAGNACKIGSGTVTATVLLVPTPLPVTLYLVPPKAGSGDFAGVEVTFPLHSLPVLSSLDDYAGVKVSSAGTLTMTAILPDLRSLDVYVTELELTLKGTQDGRPFTRMPTSCATATSRLSVTYYASTPPVTDVPGSFTPTGCKALPFAPKLTGSATKDAHDQGVKLVTTLNQVAGQAGAKTVALHAPAAALYPNAGVLSLENTGKPVGSATANSPLLPKPLTGKVFLTAAKGEELFPSLLVRFPAPFPLTLTGAINAFTNSFKFSNLPDVPLRSLTVTLSGGPNALLLTSCHPSTGTISGKFAGQNGKTASSSQKLIVQGCRRVPKRG
jgi:hypothetical protein